MLLIIIFAVQFVSDTLSLLINAAKNIHKIKIIKNFNLYL